MTDPTDAQLTDQDRADLASLDHLTEEVTYHPILQVWREILKPAEAEARKKPTPQYASRLVASYNHLTYAGVADAHARYYAKILELAAMIDDVIAKDADCLSYGTPEEDVAENSQHYKDLLRDWQVRFMEWELAWDTTQPDAVIELAAISEVHKAFFGQTGITQFLDNIKLEYTEADQAELAQLLESMKEGQ